MHKIWYVGVDVSQHTLDAAVRDAAGTRRCAGQFENTAAGHRRLLSWLTKRGRHVRVVLEATGVYSLDLALALYGAPRVDVMVVNPRAARKFAEACLQRSSTDAHHGGGVAGVRSAHGVRALDAAGAGGL